MKHLCLLLLVSGLALAEDYSFDKEKGTAIPQFIARVKLVKGKVLKISKGKTTVAEVGVQFNKTDSVTTDAKSFVKLSVVDDSTLTLGPNSRLDFEEFEFVDKNDRKIQTFIRGQLSAHVKNKAKEGDLKFKTPNAVLGVRGTHLFINHQAINGVDVSEFALLKGSAEVVNSKGERQQLTRADRLVVLHEEAMKKDSQELHKLSESELKTLAPLNPNTEEGDFMPVLPYWEVAANSIEVGPAPQQEVPKTEVRAKPRVIDEDAEHGSFNNLKKLNQELQKKKK